MKFGYHDAMLDAFTNFKKATPVDVARWYLDGTLEENLHIPTQLIARWNVDAPKTFIDDLEWFARCIDNAVFKRVQSPPIVITSKSAWGYDIRESILPYLQSRTFRKLRDQILDRERYIPTARSKKSAGQMSSSCQAVPVP